MTWRKIHLKKGAWTYKVGRGTIVIRSPEPERARFIVSESELRGVPPDVLEKGYWKGSISGVLPSAIRDYITGVLKQDEVEECKLCSGGLH